MRQHYKEIKGDKMKKLSERKKKKKYWINKNDKLWGAIIRSGGRCEVCGRQETLNAHHFFFGRANKSTRWNLKNGICLCAGCHFKAHNNAGAFMKKIKEVIKDYEVVEMELIQASNRLDKLTAESYKAINIALKNKLEEVEK